MDLTDGSMKMRNGHPSIAHHHQSLGRSIFLKRSRHCYGHQYARRNSANLVNTSTSRGKGPALHDDKFSFKLAPQCNSDSGKHLGSISFPPLKNFLHFTVFSIVKVLLS